MKKQLLLSAMIATGIAMAPAAFAAEDMKKGSMDKMEKKTDAMSKPSDKMKKSDAMDKKDAMTDKMKK